LHLTDLKIPLRENTEGWRFVTYYWWQNVDLVGES